MLQSIYNLLLLKLHVSLNSCVLKSDILFHIFLFPHSGFCIIWFYCIIFYRNHRYFIVLYRSLLFCAVYGFLKWKMIRDNGFTAISCFISVSPKFGGRIYTNFPVFLDWIIWVIEGLLRLYIKIFSLVFSVFIIQQVYTSWTCKFN